METNIQVGLKGYVESDAPYLYVALTISIKEKY